MKPTIVSLSEMMLNQWILGHPDFKQTHVKIGHQS